MSHDHTCDLSWFSQDFPDFTNQPRFSEGKILEFKFYWFFTNCYSLLTPFVFTELIALYLEKSIKRYMHFSPHFAEKSCVRQNKKEGWLE